jgi:hypothetical protein
MHDLARHAIHSSETLAATVKSMKTLGEDLSKIGVNTVQQRSQDHTLDLRLLTKLLDGLEHRSVANEKRLQNEITLVGLILEK